MTGGALVVSRSVNNHNYYKQLLESKGIKNVRVTDVDKDGLNYVIDEMKPDLMIMGARFYQCSTPYMMGLIKKDFPTLNMAALCFDEYPADLGMYFILNGVKSYFNMFEGIEQFMSGFEKILEGNIYVSEVVKKRIEMRKAEPEPARKLPQKHIEVLRCICNGFKKDEIADNLYLSERTVENYREEIYRCLNVTNTAQLFRAALRLRFVTEEELIFCPRKFTVKPLPTKTNKRRVK
jgi:DNA-binding NarL/FixJ family response regulator